MAKRKKRSSPFAPIEEAVEAFRRGEIVIVVDDEDRENEGDLTIAADKVTPAAINFMATHGRGLICMPLTEERLAELDGRGLQVLAEDVAHVQGELGHTREEVPADLAERQERALQPRDRLA